MVVMMQVIMIKTLMVKRNLFDQVGGLDESFEISLNDVDFCLKVRKLGKRVVYNPYAVFYHYESRSRGSDEDPDKIDRFHSEIVLFGKKWPEILKNGSVLYSAVGY